MCNRCSGVRNFEVVEGLLDDKWWQNRVRHVWGGWGGMGSVV